MAPLFFKVTILVSCVPVDVFFPKLGPVICEGDAGGGRGVVGVVVRSLDCFGFAAFLGFTPVTAVGLMVGWMETGVLGALFKKGGLAGSKLVWLGRA